MKGSPDAPTAGTVLKRLHGAENPPAASSQMFSVVIIVEHLPSHDSHNLCACIVPRGVIASCRALSPATFSDDQMPSQRAPPTSAAQRKERPPSSCLAKRRLFMLKNRVETITRFDMPRPFGHHELRIHNCNCRVFRCTLAPTVPQERLSSLTSTSPRKLGVSIASKTSVSIAQRGLGRCP